MMKRLITTVLTGFFLGGLSPRAAAQEPQPNPPGAETREAIAARMKWWSEARFGMFIHWDMSSIAGTEISWSRKATKPLDITGDPAGYVEDPVYDHLYQKFNPVKFNADAWVKLAQDAGMKYIVFTAKHHGGFCMWDTKLTDYSIMHAPFKRDVVKELADACHKAGMRFGLYYSQRDWHHPDYGIGDNSKYHAYLKGQLTELLTRYGKIDIMWFDSFGKGESIAYWHADEILALVKRLQPQIVVNNRSSYFGQGIPSLKADFDTPEQRLGSFQNTRAWESCMCLVKAPGGGWSYRPDGKVKPFAECLKILLGCATGDGNLLLDVGPDAQGVIPDDQAAVLREMGGWMKPYGASIYGTRGGPFRNGAWGGSTYKDQTVYLHVATWTGDQLDLPPLKAKVVTASLPGNPQAKPVVTQTAENLTITLPREQQGKTGTVVALQLDAPAAGELVRGQPLNVPAAGGKK
jgi:alpha-L-fucosidase